MIYISLNIMSKKQCHFIEIISNLNNYWDDDCHCKKKLQRLHLTIIK